MAPTILYFPILFTCTITSSPRLTDPTPAPWPEQFHSTLIAENGDRTQREIIELWYDWPNEELRGFAHQRNNYLQSLRAAQILTLKLSLTMRQMVFDQSTSAVNLYFVCSFLQQPSSSFYINKCLGLKVIIKLRHPNGSPYSL
ncbi:hypothetical protein POM88_050288 [Heracleum sosnowskyi]|uniref:Uncharacterized protein n=1 Tax=Heracleum sosnowskyi TaxID=360622 RepID=A0AAD8M2E8_9APIA|nr:hypothetical protein POM88_050288 [Heracleum sosnowskyi]